MKKKNKKNSVRIKIFLMLILFLAFSSTSFSQETKVNGIVTSADDGTGIPGVSVSVKGTTIGTITDVDGKYQISVGKSSTLVFSFVGMKTIEENVESRTTINVVLKADAIGVDEVVVTALGIKKDAKKLGYAISTIEAKDLVSSGSPNFATSLYGKATGVNIQAAPGGSTSAVSINVRGLSSITGNNQPLIIMDGAPIRNGNANEDDYWSDQRVNQNGLVDINPEDIESITILKGASASALYGSEAANGVVMITTKSGKGAEGMTVDFSMNMSIDKIAYMPEMQTEFGPGYTQSSWNTAYEKSTGGFYSRSVNGETVKSIRGTYEQWGPKYDGSEVYYWDGTYRKYQSMGSNPWNNIFRTGINQTSSLSIRSSGKKSNTRFSYTYSKNRPTQYNSDYQKHNLSLNGGLNVSDKLKLDYTANYMRTYVKNRPYRIHRLTNSYGGMFGSFEDVGLMRKMTVTSMGYENVSGSADTPTPDESFAWEPASWNLVNEYYWDILGKERYEYNNRFIGSVTPSWTIIDGLVLRGRASTDLTASETETNEHSTEPLAYGTATGGYNLENERYEIYYGDLLLNYDKKLTDKIGLSAYVGMQGRYEEEYYTGVSTNGGLSVENWFNLSASTETPDCSMWKMEYLKTAFLGSLTLSYNDNLYLEGTFRQEKTSTLAEGNNVFYYPSVNASYIFTDAVKAACPWLDYGKVRVSYGIVGNDPGVYAANMAYNQESVSGYVYNYIDSDLGNEKLKPETKYEWEFGLESKFLNNRLGYELSYYSNVVKDQILQTTTPQSAGASSIWMNVGELKNKGLEFSLYGTPIKTENIKLDLRGNLSWNRNKVAKLANGLDELLHETYDSACKVKSLIGQPMGDFYAYCVERDDDGNKIVGDDGLYVVDYTEMKKVGNAMPKLIGGFGTSLSYKNYFVDATIDFRIGGAVLNTPHQYMMAAGNIKETLRGREGHGGKSYYFVDNEYSKMNTVAASSAPEGATLYNDGIILDGVTEDGEKNTKIIPASYYYENCYGWGYSGSVTYENSIINNSYVKMRELSFGYNIPKTITGKIGCKNLSVSLYGRNLFYFFKNMPDFDAEATDGTSWVSQTWIGGSTATTRTYGFSLRASF